MESKPERTYLYGIPEDRTKLVELAVNTGIELARETFGIEYRVNVGVHILTKNQGEKFLSVGKTTKKRIDVWVSEKYLYSRGMFADLYGTIVHEYVHFIRLSLGIHDAKKIIGVTIEEGIAIYIQSMLCRPPKYLEIRSLNEKTLKTCWDTFSNVFDKPSKKYPKIESDDTYRTINYRLGFGIIEKYMESNPKMTLAKLVRTPQKKLLILFKKHSTQNNKNSTCKL